MAMQSYMPGPQGTYCSAKVCPRPLDEAGAVTYDLGRLLLGGNSSSHPAHQAPWNSHLETLWGANTGRSKINIWGLKAT